jgi:hypothetical protein
MEATLVCEKGISEVEAINNLLILQNSKTILVEKPQAIIEKIRMYYTNCHWTNHNVKTCRVKRKEESIHVVCKVTTQQIRVQRPVKYSCHIWYETRHKIIECSKFNDM